jgi:hypothetical protein
MSAEKVKAVLLRKINVTLEGLSDIMFDRFYDHSGEDRPPEKKMYYDSAGNIVLPATNIYSFLFRDEKPRGVVRFVEKNKAGEYMAIGQGHIVVNPSLIPFLDEKNKSIPFKKFDDGGKFFINDYEGGVTKMSGGKVIKQEPRKRPVMRLPWFLKFEVTVIDNNRVTPEKLESWFETGGLVTALGTHRPTYGRFMVKEWEVK